MFPASAHTTTSESNGPRKQRAVHDPLGVETRPPLVPPHPVSLLLHVQYSRISRLRGPLLHSINKNKNKRVGFGFTMYSPGAYLQC